MAAAGNNESCANVCSVKTIVGRAMVDGETPESKGDKIVIAASNGASGDFVRQELCQAFEFDWRPVQGFIPGNYGEPILRPSTQPRDSDKELHESLGWFA